MQRYKSMPYDVHEFRKQWLRHMPPLLERQNGAFFNDADTASACSNPHMNTDYEEQQAASRAD